MRVCEPLAESYELNFASWLPPCGRVVGMRAGGDERPGAGGAGDLRRRPAGAALEAVREERRASSQLAVKLLPVTFAPLMVTEMRGGRERAAALARRHGVRAVGEAADGVVVRAVAGRALRAGGDRRAGSAGAAGDRVGRDRHRRAGDREVNVAGGVAVHADPPGAGGRIGRRAGLIAGRRVRAADVRASTSAWR